MGLKAQHTCISPRRSHALCPLSTLLCCTLCRGMQICKFANFKYVRYVIMCGRPRDTQKYCFLYKIIQMFSAPFYSLSSFHWKQQQGDNHRDREQPLSARVTTNGSLSLSASGHSTAPPWDMKPRKERKGFFNLCPTRQLFGGMYVSRTLRANYMLHDRVCA